VTIVVSVCVDGVGIQASDRLVTVEAAEYDPVANKAIVLVARDGLLTIGYSGLAYIRNVPTDEVIAGLLAGDNLSQGMMGGLSGTVANLWDRIDDLRTGLSRWFQPLRLEHRCQPLELSIVGFQRRRDSWRRVSWEITNHGAGSTFELIDYTPRDRLPHLRRVGSQLPYQVIGTFDAQADDDLRNAFGVASGGGAEELENALVDGIRRIAKRTPVVGSDCLTLRITPFAQPPEQPHLLVRYHPDLHGRATLRSEARDDIEVPAIFTPWIITPGLYIAPSIVTGGGNSTVNGLIYRTELPQGAIVRGLPRGLITAQSRLRRRPPPTT
jgi:hypothetical protein